MVLWFGLFSGVRSWGQTIEGGGVYLETGARMINSLVTGNKAKEGYGIAGGDAVLLNCTVCRNFSVRERALECQFFRQTCHVGVEN